MTNKKDDSLPFSELKEISFTDFSENSKKEKASRKKIEENLIKFDIPFLDQSFVGLLPSDILLIGARTGHGKTTLVSNIALNIAAQGKKVSLFSLESREYEIEQRLKYSIYTKNYFADPKRSYSNVRFPNWLAGQLDEVFSKYDEIVEKEMEKVKNLKIFYRKSSSFNLEFFEKSFMAIESQTDVFIIDHLHYFDTDGVNENKEFTDITKKIRDLALIHNKAIILVAHIRKRMNNFDKMVLPSIDDFHGSSNITKIATKVLTIAPYPERDISNKHLYATLMQIAKFREDGAATRYTGLLWLSQETGQYSRKFRVGYMTKGDTFTDIEDSTKLPFWAKSPETLEFEEKDEDKIW